MPKSPFTTRLSGSAKETELRIRSIFQWKKKRPPVVLFVLTALVVLLCFGLVSCETAQPQPQQEEPPVVDTTPNKEPEVTGNQEPDPEVSEEPSFSFADVQTHEFTFSSGAGAWATVLRIHADGSFDGEYHDSDMGTSGPDYPNGTQYYCAFEGQLEQPVKVNEYTYSAPISSISYANETGTEEIKDGVRYVYSEAYGLQNTEHVLIYLPGAPLEELPVGYLSWVGYPDLTMTTDTELPFYGLYNENDQTGFSGYEKIMPPDEQEYPEDTRYTSRQVVFPANTLGMTEANQELFDVPSFAAQFDCPEGWSIRTYDDNTEKSEGYVQSTILSRVGVFDEGGICIGTIGYNTFEPYEGEIDPELYYQTVYSGIRLGAHYFWGDFSIMSQTDGGETHRATVYYQKDTGENAASWPTFEADGICSYDKELAIYTAFEFKDGAVDDEVLSHIAESIRIEPVESPMDAYQRNGRLATVDGISHMPLDELPQEVLDSLTLVSEGDFDGFYYAEWGYCRTYTAPGLEILTTAPSAAYLDYLEEVSSGNRDLFPTEEDFYSYIEGEEGREWLIRVIITDDQYATLDGLRVGMTCAQAQALGYSLHEGQNQIGNVEVELSILVENDIVVQMETWWTMGRYIGKFFEL